METIKVELRFRNKRYKDASKGLAEFAKQLDKDLKQTAPILKRELKSYLESLSEAAYRRHSRPWPSGTTDKTLSRRSGRAIESLKTNIKVSGSTISDIKGHLGGVFYLNTQEYGATIRPKRSKYLTVPLPPALNPDGTPKKPNARAWKNTFIATSRKGNLLIFQRIDKKIVPLYVLKKEVKIPPRLGMKQSIEVSLPYFVDRVVDQMVKELLRG